MRPSGSPAPERYRQVWLFDSFSKVASRACGAPHAKTLIEENPKPPQCLQHLRSFAAQISDQNRRKTVSEITGSPADPEEEQAQQVRPHIGGSGYWCSCKKGVVAYAWDHVVSCDQRIKMFAFPGFLACKERLLVFFPVSHFGGSYLRRRG